MIIDIDDIPWGSGDSQVLRTGEEAELGDIPALFLGSSDAPELTAEAFFEKPFRLRELGAAVERASHPVAATVSDKRTSAIRVEQETGPR